MAPSDEKSGIGASVIEVSSPQGVQRGDWKDEESGSPRSAAEPADRLEIDPEIEKRVVRKLDLRVTLLLSVLYVFSYLDRSNIGNARIAGMDKDLNLTGEKFTWLLTVFYIGFIPFQVQTYCWKIMPPHIWAAISVFLWGLFATCQSAVQSWSGEMALRFLLGAAEAGFSPGVPYLLSFFYRRHELGFRCGLFLSAAPIANTFSGALAYRITGSRSKLAPWRLLFLVEGLPTIMMAPVAFFLLPDSPSTAWFLTEEEKAVARARAIRQVGQVKRVGKVDLRDGIGILRDSQTWCGAVMAFCNLVPLVSLPVYLPTLLKDMGFTAINAQGLTVPPFILSTIVTIGTTWIADKYQQRGLVVASLSLTTAAGYVVLATCTGIPARYAGVWVTAAGLFGILANLGPWLLRSDSRRGTLAVLLSLVGQFGTIVGTNIFPDRDRPRWIKGQIICAGFMVLNFLMAMLLRTALVYQNRELDKRYGKVEQRRDRGESNGDHIVAEENFSPHYRFVL